MDKSRTNVKARLKMIYFDELTVFMYKNFILGDRFFYIILFFELYMCEI